MLNISRMEPKLLERMRTGAAVYLSRPAEIIPEPSAAPAGANAQHAESPERPQPELEFHEIMPDDEDLYPAFKVQIDRRWTGKRGRVFYAAKTEYGRRLHLWWEDGTDA